MLDTRTSYTAWMRKRDSWAQCSKFSPVTFVSHQIAGCELVQTDKDTSLAWEVIEIHEDDKQNVCERDLKLINCRRWLLRTHASVNYHPHFRKRFIRSAFFHLNLDKTKTKLHISPLFTRPQPTSLTPEWIFSVRSHTKIVFVFCDNREEDNCVIACLCHHSYFRWPASEIVTWIMHKRDIAERKFLDNEIKA